MKKLVKTIMIISFLLLIILQIIIDKFIFYDVNIADTLFYNIKNISTIISIILSIIIVIKSIIIISKEKNDNSIGLKILILASIIFIFINIKNINIKNNNITGSSLCSTAICNEQTGENAYKCHYINRLGKTSKDVITCEFKGNIKSK